MKDKERERMSDIGWCYVTNLCRLSGKINMARHEDNSSSLHFWSFWQSTAKAGGDGERGSAGALVWVAAVNKPCWLRDAWQPETLAGKPTTASKHAHTSPNKTVCGHMCGTSCSVSIVCLSCIYPGCWRLCVTACQNCVWTLNMCVCSSETEKQTQRLRGEGRVRWGEISGNCLLICLQGDFSTSLSDFLSLVTLHLRLCPR